MRNDAGHQIYTRLPSVKKPTADVAKFFRAASEWVVAIGAHRALEKSVTQGIISAKHRRAVTDPTSYQDFLQTDAVIIPGNSGGPLLNLHGEGIGFTIPSNMAVKVANALIARSR